MATKIHMEALSPTMEEGQLVKWLKSEGEDVAEGDILAEIETDKATMELVARGGGVLRKIGLPEGGTAKVGDVIGVIAAADEDIAAIVSEFGSASTNGGSGAGAPSQAGQASQPATSPTSGAGPTAASAPEPVKAAATATDGRVKASPLARRLASESGIAIESVAGSGPGGRIVKRDIEAAASAPATRRAPAAMMTGPDYEDVPVTQMRKTIARRLVESIGPVPTFYLTIDVDMTRVLAARSSVNRALEDSGIKASINDFVIKAIAVALSRHPEVNAAWQGDSIRRHHRVHMGVAVAVEDGLITPIIRDAHVKGVADIAVEVRELAGRARARKLKPDEYTGATFSVSNLGMFGIEEFTAIINPPEAGIIAVGQVEDRVVVINGEPAVQARMRMTMSCDHRVVDGATGARFLQTVRQMIEEPAMMVV